MSGENNGDTDAVKARKRIEQLEADNAEKDRLLEQANSALEMTRRRDAARVALRGKVEDPDTVADLLAPQLRDVDVETIGEHIASDDFKPRLAAFKPPPSASGDNGATEESGETTPEVGTETPGGFGGPSPGDDTGATQAVPGTQPIVVGTPAYEALLAKGDEAYDAADKAGRIVRVAP